MFGEFQVYFWSEKVVFEIPMAGSTSEFVEPAMRTRLFEISAYVALAGIISPLTSF